MGLDAQVIGVGAFSPAVVEALEYGASFYEGVEQGATVITNVFIAGNSDDSRMLAAAFGVGAMELGRHQLDPAKANTEWLREAFGEAGVANFVCLAEHGFEFFYLPNA